MIPNSCQAHPLQIPDLVMAPDRRQALDMGLDLGSELFCQRHFPLPGKIVPEDFRRQDKPLIPPLALREILVNALIHKDYTIAGGSTHLAIFDDRVEVWSAGRLPAGVTAEALSKEHLSVRRNPIIADVFHLVGLVEKWGRGTNRVIEQCQSAGIEPPSFREVGPATVVTFRVPVRLAETPQVTPQDTPQHAPQDALQLRALLEAAEQPRSRAELQAAVGLRDRKHFRKLYLSPKAISPEPCPYPDGQRARNESSKVWEAGKSTARAVEAATAAVH